MAPDEIKDTDNPAEPVEPDKSESSGLLQSAASFQQVLLAGTRDLALNLPRKIFEIDFDLSDSREELRKKVAWIIRIRFVINPAVVALMFFSNWQGLTKGASTLSRETLISTAIVAAISIALNVTYFIALKKQKFELHKFVFLQLLLDVVIFSAYIWRTGGVTSPFAFLYFLPIIGGSIMLSPAYGMAMAGLGSLAFFLIVILESTGAIPHVSYFVALDQFAQRTSYIVLMMIVNFFAFIAVAGASGFLMRTVTQKAKQLKESNLLQERKAKLFKMLYQVNEVLQYHKDIGEVLDRICDVLVTDMNVDRALMYIIDGRELKLRRVAYHKRVPESEHTELRVSIPLDPDEGLTARAAVENQAFNVADPANHEGINVELAKKIGLNPFALAPMTFRGRVVGVLGIDRGEDYLAINDDEFHVLQIFARQAGQTLSAASISD
jgi:GAF domain-containing protein